MRLLAVPVAILALSCSVHVSGMDRMTDGFTDLPKDARAMAERYMACQHFSGEFNGTGDERDRDVVEKLRELKCDRVDRDLQRIKKRYGHDPRVLEILKELDVVAGA